MLDWFAKSMLSSECSSILDAQPATAHLAKVWILVGTSLHFFPRPLFCPHRDEI